MAGRSVGTGRPAAQAVHPASTSELNITAIDQYEPCSGVPRKIKCYDLCDSQPARTRAPELLSLRHQNTECAVRNVFVEDSLVVLASKYHKGFYASSDAKIIHRYLPRDVGESVV